MNHHWTKNLVASPDGKLLYVGLGSTRPYAYLDDAPLEERRTQEVRRGAGFLLRTPLTLGASIRMPSRACDLKPGLRRKMPVNCLTPWCGLVF
jgi:glucose/arabinose dehydrogenase